MDGKAEMSEIAREFLMMSTVTITTPTFLLLGESMSDTRLV